MTYTLEDWIDTLGLKRVGKRHVGPCPLCGDHNKPDSDRFRATRGDSVPVLIACRSCIDRLEGVARAKRIAEITRAVFGDAVPRMSAPATACIPRSRESRSRTQTRSTEPTA